METGGEKAPLGIKGYAETKQNGMQGPLAEAVLGKYSNFYIITSETGRWFWASDPAELEQDCKKE